MLKNNVRNEAKLFHEFAISTMEVEREAFDYTPFSSSIPGTIQFAIYSRRLLTSGIEPKQQKSILLVG
jgi:hypothetical protein